jgi:hypothetical protein
MNKLLTALLSVIALLLTGIPALAAPTINALGEITTVGIFGFGRTQITTHSILQFLRLELNSLTLMISAR